MAPPDNVAFVATELYKSQHAIKPRAPAQGPRAPTRLSKAIKIVNPKAAKVGKIEANQTSEGKDASPSGTAKGVVATKSAAKESKNDEKDKKKEMEVVAKDPFESEDSEDYEGSDGWEMVSNSQ